ncbi:MAG TPA: helix-turn-helix domain-containing protein [Actinokineospora sp.]|nr:helix-turn-helix domain-containing protein [Actinokineospora sp.]
MKAAKAEHDDSSGRDVDAARAEARTRTRAYVLGLRLAQLRKDAGISQGEIAERMGVSQARVSQLENGEIGQMEIDTLSRYINALGGTLKLVADFEDHGITVTAPEIDRERLAI